jgi:hypothetical protein
MLGLIKKAAGQEPSFVTHLPEDKADTSRFIQSYCEDAKRYM